MSIPAPYQEPQLPLPDPEAYPGEPREYARALMQRKDAIEKEIVRKKLTLLMEGNAQRGSLIRKSTLRRADASMVQLPVLLSSTQKDTQEGTLTLLVVCCPR